MPADASDAPAAGGGGALVPPDAPPVPAGDAGELIADADALAAFAR